MKQSRAKYYKALFDNLSPDLNTCIRNDRMEITSQNFNRLRFIEVDLFEGVKCHLSKINDSVYRLEIHFELNSVEVCFENNQYDYTTSVSCTSTKKTCTDYFVGQFFCVQATPEEIYKKCIGINFKNNN